MKKLIAVAVACVGLCAYSEAKGIEAGDLMISGVVGFGSGLQDSGAAFLTNDKMDWGSSGKTIGLTYLVFPSKYFGAGVDINYNKFKGEKGDLYIGTSHKEEEISMTVFNVMASFRANLNPDARTRVYVPFGLGLSYESGEVKTTRNGWQTSRQPNYYSLGWFAGIGLETELGQGNWALGAEARYNAFTYDTDKWGALTSRGKKNYSYASVVFKVSYKFSVLQ